MLKDNLRKAFDESGLYVKDIAAKAGVNKRTIDDWIGKRTKKPHAEELYKVCRAVSITVEEALDGEVGREYVRNWVRAEGRDYKPPQRIADIVDDLLNMDDKSLSIIRGTIGGIIEGEKDVRERTGTGA